MHDFVHKPMGIYLVVWYLKLVTLREYQPMSYISDVDFPSMDGENPAEQDQIEDEETEQEVHVDVVPHTPQWSAGTE